MMRPPLRHIAAEAGDVGMMQLLVERGALLDLRDSSGSLPLHLALEAQAGRMREGWRGDGHEAGTMLAPAQQCGVRAVAWRQAALPQPA